LRNQRPKERDGVCGLAIEPWEAGEDEHVVREAVVWRWWGRGERRDGKRCATAGMAYALGQAVGGGVDE